MEYRVPEPGHLVDQLVARPLHPAHRRRGQAGLQKRHVVLPVHHVVGGALDDQHGPLKRRPPLYPVVPGVMGLEPAGRDLLDDAEIEILGVKTGPFKSDLKRDELAASLPADYVEIAGGPSDKLEKDGIGIMNLDQVYTVNLDSGEYWLLAEKPDIGMLGVPTEGDGRDVWFLYYDGREPQRLSPSFREALEKARDIV